MPSLSVWADPLPKSYRIKSSGESVSSGAPAQVPQEDAAPAPLPPTVNNKPQAQTIYEEPKQYEWIRSIPADVVKSESRPQDPQKPFINHEVLGEIYERYVTKNGWFDYRKLRRDKEDRASLHAYVGDLMAINPSTLEDPKDKMASWLNLYNAIVIEEILNHEDVDNLLKIRNFFSEKKYKIGDKTYSLTDIEEEVFRKEIHEPRTIFARVNGASSGPRLTKEPFMGEKIDKQLEERTFAFLTDPGNISYDPYRRVLSLNPMFLWYEQDFVDLRAFLASYLDRLPPIFTPAYLGYDWKINDSKYH
jgi:uncharacterized protein DUF547